MESINGLMAFGLTRQESIIYIEMLSHKEMTGYEAAKLTGISRSNAYTTLAGLVDKGAAYAIEGAPTKYTAVPAKEFCDNKLLMLGKLKDELLEQLPKACCDTEGYITIEGYENIVNKVTHMLEDAKERIYVSAAGPELELMRNTLRAVLLKNIKVVLITDEPFVMDGAIIYYSQKKPKQIGLIVDSMTVLTGELKEQGGSSCLFSGKKNLVDLFKNSLKNEIELIKLTHSI